MKPLTSLTNGRLEHTKDSSSTNAKDEWQSRQSFFLTFVTAMHMDVLGFTALRICITGITAFLLWSAFGGLAFTNNTCNHDGLGGLPEEYCDRCSGSKQCDCFTKVRALRHVGAEHVSRATKKCWKITTTSGELGRLMPKWSCEIANKHCKSCRYRENEC